jgi:hypothetical protein
VEYHKLGQVLFDRVNAHLAGRGLKVGRNRRPAMGHGVPNIPGPIGEQFFNERLE